MDLVRRDGANLVGGKRDDRHSVASGGGELDDKAFALLERVNNRAHIPGRQPVFRAGPPSAPRNPNQRPRRTG